MRMGRGLDGRRTVLCFISSLDNRRKSGGGWGVDGGDGVKMGDTEDNALLELEGDPPFLLLSHCRITVTVPLLQCLCTFYPLTEVEMRNQLLVSMVTPIVTSTFRQKPLCAYKCGLYKQQFHLRFIYDVIRPACSFSQLPFLMVARPSVDRRRLGICLLCHTNNYQILTRQSTLKG